MGTVPSSATNEGGHSEGMQPQCRQLRNTGHSTEPWPLAAMAEQ